jgi:hypothetical protein
MSFSHSSVHANTFALFGRTEDQRLRNTCLSFGVHRLSDLAAGLRVNFVVFGVFDSVN